MLKLKRNEELIILIIIGIAVAFVFLSRLPVFRKDDYVFDKSSAQQNAETVVLEPVKIYVYITGEIIRPGVYQLKTGDRLSDLIALSGGFSKNADQSSINMAQKLKDEQHIDIPSIEDGTLENKKSSIISGRININKATAEELDSFLPGIGGTLAKNITNYRDKNGGFKTADEITKVDGIGSGKRYEKIKDLITVN